MDLKQQLQRIQEQLGGLNASQKMLTASLVAIMIMTLVWWARYAATPEMVPLIDRSMNPTEIGTIQSTLKSSGVPVQITGDRIFVPVDRQTEAMVTLGYHNVLPGNMADAWDEIVEKSGSPFETAEKTSERFKKVKERTLSSAIQTYIPDVVSANVLLETVTQRRIGGGGDIKPSASVFVNTRGGGDMRKLAHSIASMVAAAQSGLTADRVSVMINGVSHRPRPAADTMGFMDGDLHETLAKLERHYLYRLETEVVRHITGALVTVSVDVEHSTSEETSTTFDKEKTFSKETKIETESTETISQGGTLSEEPGAQANTGLMLENTQSSSGTNSSTTEQNRTQMEVFPTQSVTRTVTPAGKPRVVRAAVRVPQSYFERLWKQRNPSSEVPNDAALQPLIDHELEQLKALVQTCCALDGESVAVGTYLDLLPPLAIAADTASGGGGGAALPGMIGSHVKEIAVGSLAMLSLFMVTMMLRRGSTVATVSTPIELQEVSPLATDEDVAGEAGEVAAMLDGMELDDDTIKAQQMVHQVSTMVKENPEGAANLVKRWLNRD